MAQLKGAGCDVYEKQLQERYCRSCTDAVCLNRWALVEAAFPLRQEMALSDLDGAVYVTRLARANRPLSVRWHKSEGNGWEKTSFLLYWKSLDQQRRFSDPNGRTQAQRVAQLIGEKAGILP